MSSPTVYVAIEMTFDYHEFQEVIYASTDFEEVKQVIALHGEGVDYPVVESLKVHTRLSREEVRHYWIRKFPEE